MKTLCSIEFPVLRSERIIVNDFGNNEFPIIGSEERVLVTTNIQLLEAKE